jgi:CubicO group peptidase (beta-lactamase class C family)
MMSELTAERIRDLPGVVAEVIQSSRFSGAVRVDWNDAVVLAAAHGYANRVHEIPNEIGIRFAVASGTKGLTALAVVSLIAEGVLQLSTTARSLLGGDLPLIGDDVTVEHLLAHRSGIGDYFDEEAAGEITDYVLRVPVHELDSTEAYLAALDGYPAKAAPDERFAYCNSGYVVLALLAERAAGVPFPELVRRRVCEPAGMASTGFLRSDELPADVAIGYLAIDGARSNILHLPVLGSGDGGIYSTVSDIHRLWRALLADRIVPPDWVAAVRQPRSEVEEMSMRYGLGFWLDAAGPGVMLEGYDAGVSFRSRHDPETDLTWTVVANTSEGAWPVARAIADHFGTAGGDT